MFCEERFMSGFVDVIGHDILPHAQYEFIVVRGFACAVSRLR